MYLQGTQREHEALTARVRDGSSLDAQRALLHLLAYMGEEERFVPGAHLYDSYIRDLIDGSLKLSSPS